jgi:hypothetical protein
MTNMMNENTQGIVASGHNNGNGWMNNHESFPPTTKDLPDAVYEHNPNVPEVSTIALVMGLVCLGVVIIKKLSNKR